MTDAAKMAADKLHQSGLTDAEGRYAGLKPLTAEQTGKLWPGAPKQASLHLPYHDPGGKVTGFSRIRLLGPAKGFAGQVEKPRRYLQAPGSGVEVYFPHVKDLRWTALLADKSQALVITEGELKALSATCAGVPTLGLGGVDSWASKKDHEPLLKDLSAIPWEGRPVYLAYDSDALLKPQVAAAARRLAKELGGRGAKVLDATLPPASDGKVGLDDFLVAHGVKALRAHLAGAPEFADVAELRKFNERFIFVRAASTVYEIAYDTFYDSGKFYSSVEAPASYIVLKQTANGPKSEKRSTAKDWVSWPNRRQVQKLDYLPGNALLEVPLNGQGTVLNLWPGWGCAPKAGSVVLWNKLFNYLLSSEGPEARQWFSQWLAYPLQNPGVKLYTAVAMWGAQTGTGKTLLGETMLRIYGKNGQRIGAKQLSSGYNSWAQRKQFILGDEITGNDSRSHADELKGLLTGEWLRINEKYQPEYDLPNCVNFYFTSNHPDAFFLDDYDRRFLILEAPDERLDQKFYEEYDVWLRGAGPAALFDHLLTVDLTGFLPRAPALRTRAHELMREVSRGDVGRYIALVMNDPEQAYAMYRVPEDVAMFTAKELLTFYDPRSEKRVTEKTIGVELQRQGAVKVLGGTQVRIEGKGRFRLYAVRDLVRWKKADHRHIRAYVMQRELPTPKF